MVFRWLHPDIGVRLAQYLSVKNKTHFRRRRCYFSWEDNEWLILYSKRKLETKHYNYLIFGHRHLPMKVSVEKIPYVNQATDFISLMVFLMEKIEIKKIRELVRSPTT
jgi:UDP-2,3-diacylglucosamine hydrolase